MCKELCESCGCGGRASSDNGAGQQNDEQNPHSNNGQPPGEVAADDPADNTHGNPFTGRHRRIRRLWCQTGFDLAIYPNGTVRGTQSPKNKYALLEFEAVGLDGHIRIKGISTDFYVTMSPAGKISAQPLASNRGTIWIETGLGSGASYHSLLSLDYAHKGYYLGLKKNGMPKEGPRTAHPYPQKATSFISRIVAEE